MKLRIALLLALVWMVAQPGEAATSGPNASKPNIVLILADDMGYADAGFNGGQEIKTPNLDKLARAGSILESFYVQPVCSPTRSALMTGRYPTATGVYAVVRPNAPWGLKLPERTLAEALREAGYETALCGKWHLGEFCWPKKPAGESARSSLTNRSFSICPSMPCMRLTRFQTDILNRMPI